MSVILGILKNGSYCWFIWWSRFRVFTCTKRTGHHAINLFMRNWNDESVIIDNECPWIEDSNDALQVAEI